MATKKLHNPNEPEIKGSVRFKKVDPLACYFELEREPRFLGNRNFTLDREVLPKDFNPEKYEVTGEFSIKLTITEK
jgi:hypothetical protein